MSPGCPITSADDKHRGDIVMGVHQLWTLRCQKVVRRMSRTCLEVMDALETGYLAAEP